jgi:hypothetical protein
MAQDPFYQSGVRKGNSLGSGLLPGSIPQWWHESPVANVAQDPMEPKECFWDPCSLARASIKRHSAFLALPRRPPKHLTATGRTKFVSALNQGQVSGVRAGLIWRLRDYIN